MCFFCNVRIITNEYLVSEKQLCAIEVPDEPGGLENLLELLAADGVDIQYMYSVFAFKPLTVYDVSVTVAITIVSL